MTTIIQSDGLLAAGNVQVSVGLKCEMTPAKKMGISEARDRYLAAHKDNKILDFGDNKQPILEVANELNKMVAYELVPELCDEGLTIGDLARHMKAQGHNVQGISPCGKYVMVMETTIGEV